MQRNSPTSVLKTPLGLRLKFLLWKLHYPLIIALGIGLLLVDLSPQSKVPLEVTRAAKDIAFGQVVVAEDFMSLPSSDANYLGMVSLVDITRGNVVSADLFSPSVQQALVPPDKVLVTVRLANPEILTFAQVGTKIRVFSGIGKESKQIIEGAQLLRSHAASGQAIADTSWADMSYTGKTEDLSSTVLLAVSPQEAQTLAQVPQWDSNLVAVLMG